MNLQHLLLHPICVRISLDALKLVLAHNSLILIPTRLVLPELQWKTIERQLCDSKNWGSEKFSSYSLISIHLI